MKTSLHFSLLAALALGACNAPDNALFDDSAGGRNTTQSQGGSATTQAGGGSGAEAATGAVSALNGGTSQTEAGTAGTPSAGTAAVAGSAGSGGTGNDTTPDPNNMAGANDGVAGSGEPPQPPEAVCGNGTIEAGEECDDAGHAGQDGCNACKVVCSDWGPGTLKSADFHCYNGYDEATFAGARTACEKRGAHVATIASADENKIARMFVNDGKWIGGFEDAELTAEGNGQYGWISGEPFTYTNWAKGEPNSMEYRCEGGSFNSHCYEHCIAILGDGTWADRRCDTPDGYVCEWEPPTSSKPTQ